jgi:uncharacterized protein (TIGR01777 family)
MRIMEVTISGSSGFIGSAVLRKITSRGWTARIINRQSFEMPDDEFLEKKIEGADAVINLAGAPVIRRWTEEGKKEIVESRIATTRKIANAIGNAKVKPKVLISASATGIYDPVHEHTEESRELATGFLADLCRDWEKEAAAVAEITRVVVFRTGLVLGTGGGMLKRMETPFKVGLGAMIGNGKQAFSWIHLEDLVSAFVFAIEQEQVRGAVNAVAPYPTTNYHFTKTFGKVMMQPAFLRIPEFVLRMVYGEGAQTLTTGQKVLPRKLLQSGFSFLFPTVEKALVNLYK